MLRAHKTRIRNANPGSSIARALAQHDGATRWAYNALLARLNDATQASPAGALWPSVDDLAKTLRREKPQWWATVDWEMLDNGRIRLADSVATLEPVQERQTRLAPVGFLRIPTVPAARRPEVGVVQQPRWRR